MREMQPIYFCFTFFNALWMQVLILPPVIEGLTCFSCSSKANEGCKNDDLKSGHRNNMFSEKCAGSDAVCVKQSLEIKGYYEEHYSRADLKRYYAAMDEAAECRGLGVTPHPPVTGAPGDNETTTSTSAAPADDSAAPGPAPGADAAAAADGGEKPAPAGADPAEAAAETPSERRRRAVAANCPEYPKEFPEPQALVEKGDQRWIYSCGNRSEWHHAKIGHCHRHSDGILQQSVCICNQDLCNAAAAQAAVPFLVLAAALLHLHGMID